MRGLPQEQKERLRRFFTGTDNLDQLQYLICLYVQDFLPTYPSSDPDDLKLILIRRLGQELRTAIIKKLRQYYPKDAHRNEALLLRSYPDRAIELLQQALSHLLDIWIEDNKKVPNDTLVKKCQRLLPLLSSLPDLRGKSVRGKTSQIFGLVLYQDAKILLQRLPRGTAQTLIEDDKKRRERFFSNILTALQAGDTGLSSPPSPILIEAFRKAAENNFADWMRLSRTQIAGEIAAKAVGQSADYFIHSVKRLRNRAQTVNRFLKSAR